MPDYYFCYVEGTVQIDESKGGSLPNFLAGTVKHLKMSLECKEDIDFKSASIYKYKVGMDKARLILDVDMSEITDTISYEEDNPLMNSTYILYYEVAR